MDVFFDDLHVTHVRGRLMEEQHYYPHGLLINKTIAAGAIPENKYQFEGKKMQDEIGLKLYDFHARQYDPQIGRFWGVDPANQFPSGYTGIGNDPANLTDPTGMQVGGGGGSPLGIEASSDAEARKNYVDRGRRAEKFQLYVDGQFAGWENWENIPFIGVGTPTVDLSQSVTLETKNVGGKAIQGYWRNTNRTDFTKSGCRSMNGQYTDIGEPITALQFIPFGYKGQSNGGEVNQPWVKTANDIYGQSTFIPGTALSYVETKVGKMMSIGGSHVWKSSTYSAQRNIARELAIGSKGVKIAGNSLGVVGIGITLYDMGTNGVTTSNSIDLIMGGVSFIPGCGWIAGGIYFIVNAALKAETGKDLGEHIDSW